eukprot:TRINITY_DN3294_c0_g2_i1.p1 TRINITY_DN3294_c0_g2~~TRINITY_DN3294_c0_g2_i1.p1  ORF type:complete len:427 (+),score=138.92 TRINITY_DN3294_c0_g2_i1:73-1353(+)
MVEFIAKAHAENPVAILNTHDGNSSSSRPMMLLHDPLLGYYMVTRKDSRKLDQIAKNNDVHLLVGKSDLTASCYTEVLATCYPSRDSFIKRHAWRDIMTTFGYPSAESDLLVVLLLAIDTVTFVDMKTHKQETVKVPMPRILVTGASGNNGNKVAEYLLATKLANVRAGLRDTAKGTGLAALGAELAKLDWDDPATIAPAFENVDRVFLLAPLTLSWVGIFKAAVAACKAANVKYIVEFSAMGASADNNMWLSKEHAECEKVVKESGIAYTILQPSFFADNFVNFAGRTIKENASIFHAAGDGKASYIATEDIAAVATTLLLNPTAHAGKSLVLTGPAALSGAEVASIIGKIIGKEIKNVDLPAEVLKKNIEQTGMPEKLAQGLIDLENVKKAGYAAVVTDNVKQVTGKEPMSLEQYILAHKQQLL